MIEFLHIHVYQNIPQSLGLMLSYSIYDMVSCRICIMNNATPFFGFDAGPRPTGQNLQHLDRQHYLANGRSGIWADLCRGREVPRGSYVAFGGSKYPANTSPILDKAKARTRRPSHQCSPTSPSTRSVTQRVQLECQYGLRAPKPQIVRLLGPGSIMAL